MSEIVYKVIRHDGGWAYQANGTFSVRLSPAMQPGRPQSSRPPNRGHRASP